MCIVFKNNRHELTIKITHNAAHSNATGHAKANNKMSHNRAKIGFDAILFASSSLVCTIHCTTRPQEACCSLLPRSRSYS